MNPAKNILAIEGEWTNRLTDKETIKSSLTFLEEIYGIQYIFRKVNTFNSLVDYLDQGTKASYKNYGIIVLAFHGSNEGIRLEGKDISLENLAMECDGILEDKLVHFSSCAIFKDIEDIKFFKKITGAKKVMGYSENVDFLESTLFDIALLQKLNAFSHPKRVDKNLQINYPALYDRLGFKMV
ncbi:MAG: hypothetical protein JJE55_14095 [Flavobacteriaceae bacterium]|nr:hypothetical protein [Flavobacteriaceae bacterium]